MSVSIPDECSLLGEQASCRESLSQTVSTSAKLGIAMTKSKNAKIFLMGHNARIKPVRGGAATGQDIEDLGQIPN